MKVQKLEKQRWEDYFNQSLPKIGAESVGIVPTNACNLNCITCWSYSPLLESKPQNSWKKQFLDFDIFKKLLEDLAFLQTKRIILTGGGDPLVYPHFEEVVKIAKSLDIKITLISNLTLIKNLSNFLELKIDTVQANFSAADEESYLAFHPNRKPSDFERMMLNLEEISKRSELKLVCVICKTNAHLIKEMLRIANSLKANIQFKLMSITEGTEKLAISEEQRQKLLEIKDEIISFSKQFDVRHNLLVFFRTLQGKNAHSFPIEHIGCFVGYWYSRVWADGSVHFCCNPNQSLKIGSLYHQNFTEIWQSVDYQNLRNSMRKKQFVEGCDKCGKFDLNYKLKQNLDMNIIK
ncbi:MAG: radical SAM protein [Flammeovirgaceae bacterium]